MIGKLCVAMVLLAMLSGCAAGGGLSREMADWQGKPVAVVLDEWGTPDAQAPIGDETLLTWYDRAPVTYGFIDAPAVSGVICERMLAVTDAGTITGWRWRGDHCNEVPASTRSRSLSAASQANAP